MKASENCHASHGRQRPPPSEPEETLRVQVAEIGARAGRLIATLRSARKEKKVLAGVWAGLRQLYFAGGS